MTLLDLQKKRHEQLDKVLKDISTSRLRYVIDQLKENKGTGQDVIHISEGIIPTFTFFETDIEYITTLISIRNGEEFFRIIDRLSKEKFASIPTSELQQALDMLTVEQWGRVESIGETVINLGGDDIPAIQKELERRKTVES